MSKRRTPTFRYEGGRAVTRIRIVDHFPPSGLIYCEPFAGAGNVFFEALMRRFNYQVWWVNDIVTFLPSLKHCNLGKFPSVVDREVFDEWSTSGSMEAEVFARAISYGGYGYHAGFIGEGAYNRDKFLEDCWIARGLLHGKKITNTDWKYALPEPDLGNAFVYFDPPQYGRNTKAYPQIDHQEFLRYLHGVKYKWAVTQSDVKIYRESLHSFENNTIDDDLRIWTNYPLTEAVGWGRI